MFDLGEREGNDAAGEIEEIDDAILLHGSEAHKLGQGKISRQGVTEEATNDDFFVRRRHGTPLRRIVARRIGLMSKKLRGE
jgi:hypothetical protein